MVMRLGKIFKKLVTVMMVSVMVMMVTAMVK